MAESVTATVGTYRVPETGAMTWATVVGSPAPIDRVLARFTKPLTDVSVSLVNRGERRPAHAPSLPAGLVPSVYFYLSLSDVAPEDLFQAHITFFVEKSWLEAKKVHKWSVLLYRLDTRWTAFPTRRIRDDAAPGL